MMVYKCVSYYTRSFKQLGNSSVAESLREKLGVTRECERGAILADLCACQRRQTKTLLTPNNTIFDGYREEPARLLHTATIWHLFLIRLIPPRCLAPTLGIGEITLWLSG